MTDLDHHEGYWRAGCRRRPVRIAGCENGAVAVNRDPGPKDIAVPVPASAFEATNIEADGAARTLDAEEVSRMAADGVRLASGATLVVEKS